MINGVKGIFLNKQSGKFDVRINRQNVTYNLGKYKEFDEAKQALFSFLEEYAKNPPAPVIEKYSKKWWELQRKEQREKFRGMSR